MEEHGIDQAELARLASVSQSSISRLLGGREPQRLGSATRKLFSYMQQDIDGRVPPRVSNAVARIWNRTPAHAEALARIIEATEGLAPVDADERQ
jgi:predicted transcriptional regulator